MCDYEKNKSIKKVVDWSKTLTDVSIIPKREIKLQFLEELQTHSIVHYLGFFPYLIKCQQTYQKNDVSTIYEKFTWITNIYIFFFVSKCV